MRVLSSFQSPLNGSNLVDKRVIIIQIRQLLIKVSDPHFRTQIALTTALRTLPISAFIRSFFPRRLVQ